jgi:hypothetical protein
MAVTIKELREWLDTFEDENMVGVEEGGLTLEVVGLPQAYFEIGGIPEEEEDEDWP